MRILFVSSSLPTGHPSPIIASQATSIEKLGASVSFFLIRSKGFYGYIKEIFRLRKYLKKESFNIYHAHYGLSAIVATFAGAKPLVVSLMGSDIQEGGWQKWLIKLFVKRRWSYTITKSEELAQMVDARYCAVLPNGVDIDTFLPLLKDDCKKKLNLNLSKRYILFAANPKRPEKNFRLAQEAFGLVMTPDIELVTMGDIPHVDVPIWMNAADVVILSSLWEGSPNVVKEAMACNKPVVVTDVGDVRWLFGDEPGYFISSSNSRDYAEKMSEALLFACNIGKTNGRERLFQLKLDAHIVAKTIIEVYKKLVNEA